jgi:hypothetical protein
MELNVMLLGYAKTDGTVMPHDPKLKAGEWVEVKSREEILQTLDADGRLEGMPFMPEMLAFCGRRFQVYKRAHKTCDTVFPVRGRRVEGTVHLETRCDGQAHGGCQAGCLLFWKEDWLRRVDGPADQIIGIRNAVANRRSDRQGGCTEAGLIAAAAKVDPASGQAAYVCQATRLPYMTSDLHWWQPQQYVEDYTSGNVGLGRILAGFIYSVYYNISQAGIGVGRPLRWLYDRLHPLWGGTTFPRHVGTIPAGQRTPTAVLNLQAGELVRVKSHAEILKTIDDQSRNRGLWWDAEMVPYCGGTYRVLRRVTRIIDERTGKMQEMKNPCIILDDVTCTSRYSDCRMFCPRSIYTYWREIWLERVEPAGQQTCR